MLKKEEGGIYTYISKIGHLSGMLVRGIVFFLSSLPPSSPLEMEPVYKYMSPSSSPLEMEPGWVVWTVWGIPVLPLHGMRSEWGSRRKIQVLEHTWQGREGETKGREGERRGDKEEEKEEEREKDERSR
jgi:hypothetical protein